MKVLDISRNQLYFYLSILLIFIDFLNQYLIYNMFKNMMYNVLSVKGIVANHASLIT